MVVVYLDTSNVAVYFKTQFLIYFDIILTIYTFQFLV